MSVGSEAIFYNTPMRHMYYSKNGSSILIHDLVGDTNQKRCSNIGGISDTDTEGNNRSCPPTSCTMRIK